MCWPGGAWRTGTLLTPGTAATPSPRSPAGWGPSPLGHDLEGVRQIALHVLHLERVSVADLVIRAPIVGVLHHDDVAARAPQLDGVAFTCQLTAHQPKREPGPAQACREEGEGVTPRPREGGETPAEEAPPPA